MLKKAPIKNSYWLHDGDIFKVCNVSSGTDEIILEKVCDGTKYSVRFSLFRYAYERVFRVGEVAKLFERSTRSIYRYEERGIIGKPKCSPDKLGRMVRYYTRDELIEMHKLLSEVHQGRPRKDKRIINNSLIDIGNFKIRLRERLE